MKKKNKSLLLFLVGLSLTLSIAQAQEQLSADALSAQSDEQLPDDIYEMGLDQVLNMDIVVTLPGKKEDKASNAASAVYVISQNDIKNSGATHVAELLRMVPGVDVARVSSDRWAVSIRGFNQVFANKLLVLIDGVNVFSPITNGVNWESNELLLDNIERIEVVRGPGGALWGSNAVNGVINIITKHTQNTKGTLAAVGGGTHERAFASFRQGGQVNDTAYRIYATFRNRAENKLLNSSKNAGDDWQSFASGVRFDRTLNKEDDLVFLTDYQYQEDNFLGAAPSLEPLFGETDQYRGRSTSEGVNSLLSWTRKKEASESNARVSLVTRDRHTPLVDFKYEALNFDLQHRFKTHSWQELVVGTGYRLFNNNAEDTPRHLVTPDSRSTNLYNIFLNDEISLIPDKFKVIIGGKFEHHEQTGLEIMPSLRVMYKPSPTVTTWAGVSRAVAPPAIFFEDTSIPLATVPVEGTSMPGLVTLNGNRGIDSEELTAWEIGIRKAFSPSISFDVATFYNDYNDIFSSEPGTPSVSVPEGEYQPAVIIPLNFDNRLAGHSYGGEISMEWKPSSQTSLTAFYSYLETKIDLIDSLDVSNKALIEGASPRNQAGIRTQFGLLKNVSIGNFLRYVDHLPSGRVKSYVELDTRLAWQVTKSTELSLVGQNLLHNSHQEFQGNLFGPPATELERSLYGMVKVTF